MTAYHLLAGKPPFDGETALAIAVQHVKNEPESLAEIRPDAPAELIELINAMMAKAPDDRPVHAGELLKRVKAIKVDMDEDWDQLVETLAMGNTATVASPNLSEARLAVTLSLIHI